MDSACWLLDEDDEEEGKVNEEAVNRAVMIVLACSDAMLRLLVWQDNKLSVQDEAVAGEHCLLQVAKCEGTDKVVTGSTWGDLMVWKANKTKLALLGKIMVHQSGVNCLQVKAKGTEGEHLILTGGDDCLVVLSRLVVKKNKRVEVEKAKEVEVEKTKGGEVVEMHMLWASTSSNWSHSAQVTGLNMISTSLAVSIGVDFRLAVWKIAEDKASCIAVRVGAVADPQGLVAWQEEKEEVEIKEEKVEKVEKELLALA